ncbi:hypothetical protein [Actinomadura litoris]|uniref:hypothetical protein n=1 Tax=Actinomadura litoris TaxID=2678616 RepID=UPI001FA6E7F4|nr:hypothetical protein [Actinomadura litoris]
MPLSDAAKALLALRKGGAKPAPTPEPEPTPEDLDAKEQERREGFRARAKREAERFELATDTEYWVALCFREAHHPAAFCEAVGVQPDENGYLSGPELRAAVGELAPRSARDRAKALLAARKLDDQDKAGRMGRTPTPDPLADVSYTGDLAEDAAAEFDALLAGLTAPSDPNPAYLLDSPHWIAVHWPSRDDKEAFLGDTGWDALGNKYLDGHQAASILHIEMKE